MKLKKISKLLKLILLLVSLLLTMSNLTLSWRRSLSYRNQSIDLLCKSVDWFLHDIGLHHERVNEIIRHFTEKKFSEETFDYLPISCKSTKITLTKYLVFLRSRKVLLDNLHIYLNKWTLPQVFFKQFASKNQLPGFYIKYNIGRKWVNRKSFLL